MITLASSPVNLRVKIFVSLCAVSLIVVFTLMNIITTGIFRQPRSAVSPAAVSAVAGLFTGMRPAAFMKRIHFAAADQVDGGGIRAFLGNVRHVDLRNRRGAPCAISTRSDRHHRSKQTGNSLALNSTRDEYQARALVGAGPCRERYRRMK